MIMSTKNTLKNLRVNLGWSTQDLAEKAGITRATVGNAEKGGVLSTGTAKAIADALSEGYGREIRVTDIEELNVR